LLCTVRTEQLRDGETGHTDMVVRRARAKFIQSLELDSCFIILYFLIFTYLSAMSDREGHSGPPGDDDLSLPKATVAKMISGICLELNSCTTHLLGLSRTTTERYRLRQRNTGSRHRMLRR